MARDALAGADAVTASDLTLLECDRALVRGMATGDVAPGEGARLRGLLDRAAAHWNMLRIDGEVIARARQPFPFEPLRALDAVHLASALIAATHTSDLALLSFDHRIRRAARLLGLALTPA